MAVPAARPNVRRIPWSPLLAGAFACVAIASFYDTTLADADLWWHLAYGRHCVEHRTLTVDHASYAWTDTSASWVYVSWLGDVILYAVHDLGGEVGLRLLQLAAYAVVAVLVWRSRRDRDARVWPVLLLMGLAVALVMKPAAVQVKNSLFSAAFAAAVLAVYCHARRGRGDRFWVLPPLYLAWVNCHGEVLLGEILLGCLTGGELLLWWSGRPSNLTALSRRHLLVGAGLSLAALACTPEGLRLPFYWLGRLSGDGPALAGAATLRDVAPTHGFLAADRLQEWPRAATTWLWLAMTATLGAALLDGVRRRRWVELPLGLAAIAFVGASWFVGRLILLAPLVWLFTLGTALDGWALANRPRARRMALAMVAVLGVGCLAAKTLVYYEADFGRNRLTRGQPVAAARFVADHDLPGPLFNDYQTGGYLIWALGPTRPVYIDPRFTLYPPAFRDAYASVQRHPTAAGLAALAAAHPFQTAIVSNVEGAGIAAVLAADPAWTLVCLGPAASVFVRAYRVTPELAAAARGEVLADRYAGESDLRTLIGLVNVTSAAAPGQALRLLRTLERNVPDVKLLKRPTTTAIERSFEARAFAPGGDAGQRGERLAPEQVRQRFALYYRQGDLDVARFVATGYLAAHPRDAAMQYNLACVESRAGDLRAARRALAAALAAGYDQYDRIAADEDLAALRAAPGFQELLDRHRPRAAAG
ncbi:MAG TPA: hypothetical protein PLL30_08515 [Candidatus Krumholzibacteria bacterium]|nr:hypothetical protein [Candidatus Krumholzibacteria bacterium]HPD71801.1 hypothetical protein [Candidatus Krumholzibacteria bacterium]HRY41266.1 hypothetical protein [Candidatus Krumholzibacteria bacterium]